MVRTKRRVGLFAIALVAALLAPVPVAWADEDDDNGEEHKVESRVEDDKLTVLIERETAALEDKLEITLDVPAGVFKLTWEEENATTETEQKLELHLGRLLEYEDTNGNGRFDKADREVQAFDLGNGGDGDWQTNARPIEWDALVVVPTTADDGTRGQRVVARASLGDQGTFGLDLFLFDASAKLAGQSLEPTSLKFDILIDDFPYAEDGTALAVVLETRSESEFEVDAEDGEAVAVSGNAPVALAFTWIDEVEVDGRTEDLGTTVLSEETEHESEVGEVESERKTVLAFSYPRGSSILHDPTLGIQDAGQRSTPDLTLFAVLATLAIGAAIVRQRRG